MQRKKHIYVYVPRVSIERVNKHKTSDLLVGGENGIIAVFIHNSTVQQITKYTDNLYTNTAS